MSRPIRTLFVANRGEIAARIERTARLMGIEAVLAHRTDPTLDLLDGAAVIDAARAACADALHPGYGFLAENAAFAAAVEEAGLAWIGPPSAAIRSMGDKSAARRLAASLGIPIVPGYDGDDQTDECLAREAERIGYPVLAKPAGGGGGKGMRAVLDPSQLAEALAASRREAAGAFGDDRLILERLLVGPRHVEVQVLFDAAGRGIGLGERDCSLQRRHQKVLEETPSPAVGPELRSRLGEAALRLAEAVGYRSAGTVEFLVDDSGDFFFLEMNTRLQVEHPVTELVTGRDLVADQLRIVSGAPLAEVIDAADPSPPGLAAGQRFGHAVEVRLYAEDPESGFLPSTGRIELLRWPDSREVPGVRIDAGIEAGDSIGGRFDPLLAKIVAGGRDRAEAFDRLTAALDRTVVLGLTTNLRFLRWLVRRPEVLAGDARIDTVERTWRPDEMRITITDEAWGRAATLLVAATTDRSDPWSGGWRLNAVPRVRLAHDEEERTVASAGGPEDDPPAELAVLAGDTAHVDVEARSVAFRLAPPPDVERAARAHARHGGASRSEVVAPMPGSVLAVHVEPGRAVEAGDPVATLEAMKMEHVVAATGTGRVAEVLVRAGDQVARGQLLILLEQG